MVIKNIFSGHNDCSIVIFFVAFFLHPIFAFADSRGPSFDCNKASEKVEKAICGDDSLSGWDRQLSELYKAKRVIPGLRDKVRESQLKWLRTERAKCEHIENAVSPDSNAKRASCIKSAYKNRIQELHLLKVDSVDAAGKPPIKFKLMTGSRYPLCQDYVDMLNETGYIDAPVCRRKILPDFSKFKTVKWTEITDKKEIKKMRKEQVMMEYLWPLRRRGRAEKRWLWVESEMDAGKWPVLFRARIDIDHDGQEDTVYRFIYSQPNNRKYGKCIDSTHYFVVYDDPDKTRDVYERGRWSMDGPPPGAHEIFYYDGRAFQDYWNSWTSQYQLKVNELSGIANQVCGINMVQ